MKRIAAILVLTISAFTPVIAADNPLIGAWKMDGSQSHMAGIYIYTEKFYSMMAALENRPDIVDTSKATADELRTLWGPMLANTGVYEISGDLITIHPTAAKSPVVMKPGANEVYRFHIDGDTLTLTQVRNARGVEVQAAPVKFTRMK